MSADGAQGAKLFNAVISDRAALETDDHTVAEVRVWQQR
jgi:hypothetical protein